MFRTRTTCWTLLAAVGFALAAPSASGQMDLPKRPDTSKVIEFRDTPRGGIPKDRQKDARDALANFAKYFADVVAHPAVWKASQDFKLDTPGVRVPTLEGPDGIFKELDRFIIEPIPSSSRINQEPADYIREFGVAFDAALKNQISTHPERIVRINTCRLLAHVARTGAPAHFATVTELLSNANTPTEVKYYLFQAAGALLAANDPTEMRVRRHAADAKSVGALVKALEDCITDPAMLVTGLPPKAADIPPDQLAVIAFVRRQAVKALSQVKFVTVPGPDGKTPLYPSYTLVRVAMSDPALVPAPGPAEAAEAAIGICTMAPVTEQLRGGFAPVKGYNADVAVEAVTVALANFASPRAARADDKTLPWRTYAARIAEAMRNWRPMFDPDYDPAQPAKYDPQLVPAPVESMFKEVVPKILAPMDKADIATKVDLPWLNDRIRTLRANPKRNTRLFADLPQTSIEFPQPK